MFKVYLDTDAKLRGYKFIWCVVGGLGAGKRWIVSKHETEKQAQVACDKYNR